MNHVFTIFYLISSLWLSPLDPPSTPVDADPKYSDIRTKLLDLAARDQQARQAMLQAYQSRENGGSNIDPELARSVQEIDAESTAYLQKMVDRIGWPTFDMIGKEAANAAWLLAQHADQDPKFQAKVLELMKPLLKQKQVSASNFALLTDRVALARGQGQIYGTQFGTDSEGILRPRATINWDQVDKRRKEVGLPPIAEYANVLASNYGGKVDLTPLPLP